MSTQGELRTEDPRIGLVLLDRYRVVRKIGAGGMGDVYEGVHQLIGKQLAIKCMHADFAANAEAVKRFQQEARAATSVGNEHIVDVSDMGELPDGSPFMVMEFLKGQELAGLIASESPLPIPRVIAIALEVLEALHAAHESGVVHRDMKPENIFLVERGGNKDFVKVLDFGISMITETADASLGRMTQTGMAMGTPNYMSPEQARGAKGVDRRTDLYSMGVILFEALTGQVPFEAGSLAVLMTKILTESPQSICEFRQDVPYSLSKIVLRAMAKEADVRFEDAEEFADALRPYLQDGYDQGIDNKTISLQSTETVAAKPIAGSTAEVPSHNDLAARAVVIDAQAQEEADDAIPEFSPGTLMAAGIDVPAKRKGKYVVAGVAIAAIAAVVLLTSSGDPMPIAKRPQVTTEHIATEPTPPATVLAKEVRVQIRTEPPGAAIYLDGAKFPNPMDVARPRSLAPVRIQVVLPNHQSIDDVAIFDTDRDLVFTLQKSEVPATKPPIVGEVPVTKPRKGKRGKKGQKKNTVAKQAADKPTDTSNEKPNTKNGNSDNSVYTGSKGKAREEF